MGVEREGTVRPPLRRLVGTIGHIADGFSRCWGAMADGRRMEEQNALRLPALALSPRGTANSYKVRRGKIGGYVDDMSAETIAYIDRRVRRELPAMYGYPMKEPAVRGAGWQVGTRAKST